MYILTLHNEIYEYQDSTESGESAHIMLYHSSTLSLACVARPESGGVAINLAIASLPDHINGVVYRNYEQEQEVISTDRPHDWGTLVEDRLQPSTGESPTLGEIPPDHKEILIKAIRPLTASAMPEYQQLQEILTKTSQRFQNQLKVRQYLHYA